MARSLSSKKTLAEAVVGNAGSHCWQRIHHARLVGHAKWTIGIAHPLADLVVSPFNVTNTEIIVISSIAPCAGI